MTEYHLAPMIINAMMIMMENANQVGVFAKMALDGKLRNTYAGLIMTEVNLAMQSAHAMIIATEQDVMENASATQIAHMITPYIYAKFLILTSTNAMI